MELPEISDFRKLFLKDTPLLDVRAPVEFSAGAFPYTENLPLLEDEERHLIGIRYKENGQEAAIELGRELIDGQPKVERTKAWKAFVDRHPGGALYCFRGGMRSKIAQEWIYEATGIAYPRIKGGYKALRNFLLEEIEVSCQEINPIILGGRTGAGKTLVLHELANSIDLEGLAWHRGSAFGRHATPQPTQIDFENRLSIELIKHRAAAHTQLVLEDESKAVGSRHLPPILYETMSASPLVMLDVSLEERIHNSIQEYVIEALQEYQKLYGEETGFDKWSEYATESLQKIRKRLGGVRYKEMNDKLQHAIQVLRKTGKADTHADWISQLLTDYYDPMYDYQLAKKSHRIIYSGNRKQVEEYLR